MVPVSLIYKAVPQHVDDPKTKLKVDNDHVDFVNKVYENIILSTDLQKTSASEFVFLSSTDPTDEGLSDHEKRKRTDPELMAPIPGPESQLQEVKKSVGLWSGTSLENLPIKLDDLFMKQKADIGRCTISKHPVDVEPGAVLHREGARRMSPEKAERANQEVRNLLDL